MNFGSTYVLSEKAKNQRKQTLCKLCHKETDNHSIKILSCLHEFCEACLKKFLVNKSLICPECGKSTPMGYQGIHELPSTVFFNQIKDIQDCGLWIQQRRDAFCWENWRSPGQCHWKTMFCLFKKLCQENGKDIWQCLTWERAMICF